MISLLQLCVVKQWKIQLSSKELDHSVFESNEGAFVAGFIAGSMMKKTGPYTNGTTRYSKGIASFQTYSVEKKFGKVPWLRTGGMDNLMSRLSGMKGFNKDYWGLRGTLAAILKSVDPIEVSDIKTYFLPKSEVMKHIKTKLPYENGGLFRSEEIAFLSAGFSGVKDELNEFLMKLEHPTEEFILNFQSEYAPIKSAIERAESRVRLLAVNRSKELFPPGKKKSIMKFKAQSLEDKLETLGEDKPHLFAPESLPGIKSIGESKKKPGSQAWRAEVYSSVYQNPLARDVVDSWYTKFFSSEDEN